jgi:signal transduction histidine kinase
MNIKLSAKIGSAVTRARTIGVAAILLILAVVAASAAEPKRVLILHSFGRDFRPWGEYAKAIRAELERQSPWPLDLHEHSLVTARTSDENPEVPFVEYLRALYAKNRPDLIVSIGAPAAAFVQRHRQQIFPGTPMVLAVVDQRRVQYSVLTDNDAVVAVAIDYFAAIENILRVLPNTKSITVVVGTSPIEKFWKEAIGKEVEPLAGRIAFAWTDHLLFEDLLRLAAALPPHSAIFWELMIVDAAGVVHEEGKALAQLHAVANAPIFSYTDAFFGREIVGGPHVPVVEHGQRVGEIAVRILGGEKAGDIKIPPVGMARPKFDWREMSRWGISESRLPSGSDIHFRNPTLWEQYRVQIVGVIGIVLGQSALIGWLLYEHRRRRRSEAAAHELSGRLISAQEEERARLARELHDDVTQRLGVLAIDAGREERNLAKASGAAAWHTMREGLARLSSDVHALSYRLHPSILRDLGLPAALKSECEHIGDTTPLQLDLDVNEVPEQVPPDVALCLFRITQESLRNIVRHASASRVSINLRRLNSGLQLTVKDNGQGFDPEGPRAKASLGLASMRQRVALLGGKLKIDSRALNGTTISAWVPFNEATAEEPARVAG